MKNKTYYTLATNEDGAGWAIHAGDYDRDAILDEQDDFCDGGIPRRLTKILRTGDAQADIDAAIAKLNGGAA